MLATQRMQQKRWAAQWAISANERALECEDAPSSSSSRPAHWTKSKKRSSQPFTFCKSPAYITAQWKLNSDFYLEAPDLGFFSSGRNSGWRRRRSKFKSKTRKKKKGLLKVPQAGSRSLSLCKVYGSLEDTGRTTFSCPRSLAGLITAS